VVYDPRVEGHVAYQEGVMIRGDAKDCRDNAERCVQMANDASDVRLQSALFDIAQSWTALAVQLERGQSIRDQIASGKDIGSR
jgi:hypothetical protein